MKKLISILIVGALLGALSIGCSQPEEQGAAGTTGGTPPTGATGDKKSGQTAPDVKADGGNTGAATTGGAAATTGGAAATAGGAAATAGGEAPKTDAPKTDAPKTDAPKTESK
ncbi:MAG: hypothetical protein JSS66_12415 [Armatimonadetes bacterium]|nr:hypothetical protein [Armatimonadota bacterium]